MDNDTKNKGLLALRDKMGIEVLKGMTEEEINTVFQKLHDNNLALKVERNAIAAHVQLLSEAGTVLTDPHDLDSPAVMRWDKLLEQAPEANLAEHNAQVISNLKFPTMLRKMWSGGEVQDWLNDMAEKAKES